MAASKLSARKKLVWSLVTTLLILLALEACARVAYTVLHPDGDHRDAAERGDWKIESPDFGWVPKPHYHGPVYGARRQFDADGLLEQDSRQIADRSVPRIVFLGDSSTFGIKVSTGKTFVERVDGRLPRASAINLGVIGYSSYQGLKAFRRYLERDVPDIAVVSFNFNDRRSVLADHIDSDQKFQAIYSQSGSSERVGDILDQVYLCRAIRSVCGRLGVIPDAGEDQADESVPLDDLHPRVSPEQYRRNLEEFAEIAAREGISLVFMTMNDNPVLTEYLIRGIRHFDSGRYNDAIRDLKVALGKDGINQVVARAYLAKACEAQGLSAEAEEYATLYGQFASQAGRAPRIVDRQYNQVMRDVAEQHGIAVVDAGKTLDATPSDYLDFCHPDSNGHRKIADLLAPRLAEMLASRRTAAGASESFATAQEGEE